MSDFPIPDDIKVKVLLQQGSVYYFKHDDFPEDPHYFVVLNKTPLEDDSIVLCVATSQVPKKEEFIRQRKLPEETLVIVEKKNYKHFSKNTAFNCNTVHSIALATLIEKVAEENKFFLDPIPKDILEKLILGVKTSPVIENGIKKKL
jgi:hypothetical protein